MAIWVFENDWKFLKLYFSLVFETKSNHSIPRRAVFTLMLLAIDDSVDGAN